MSMFRVVLRLICGVCAPVCVGFGRGGDMVFEPAMMISSSSGFEEGIVF